jgi:antitoxin HicB
MNMEKNLQYFLALPYKIELIPVEEGGYVITIPDLPGCISQGETVDEAIEMIQDAKVVWLETALENGIFIPEPVPNGEEFSGKFNLRVPRSLHRDLVKRAKQEEVSLNQLAVYLLTNSLGRSF